MTLTVVDQWQLILTSLKDKIPEASYSTWFNHTSLDTFTSEEVVIGVASLFIKERINVHYRTLISDSIYELFSLRPVITFRISAVPLQKLREAQKEQASLPALVTIPPQDKKNHRVLYQNRLNPDFTLDGFLAGPENMIALGACRRVIASPAEFNPLTIRGGSGLGKTHLLQAVCHEILRSQPDRKVLYLSCESFANQFLKAVVDKDRATFQQRFRSCDVLIIDDIQYLIRGNKEATQEEVLHTFDTLHTCGKQIILSCDQDPMSMEGLMPRLAKRFISGLTVSVEAPSKETCKAIVLKKASLRALPLREEDAELIVMNTAPCGREIEGAVTRLSAICKITGREPSEGMIKEFLSIRRSALDQVPPPSVESILEATAEVFSITLAELTGRNRHQRVKDARKTGMIIARQLTGAPLSEIGNVFGGRNHATVLQAVKNGMAFLESTETIKTRSREIRGRFPHAKVQQILSPL